VTNTLATAKVRKTKVRLSFFKRSTLILIYIFSLTFISLNSYGSSIDAPSAWMLAPLNQIDELNKKDPALALSFTKKLLTEHHRKMTNLDKGTLFSKMARHNYFLGHYSESQNNLDRAYALNIDLTTNLGISLLLTQGGVMGELGNTEQAMKKFLLAEEYAKINESPKLLADAYAYIAYLYSNEHNYTEALKFYHQAYLLFEKLGDELNIAYLKAEMSNCYSLLFDDAKAIELATEASNYFNEHKYYFDELFAQNILAKIYYRKKSYQKAEATYLRVIELTKHANQKAYIYLAYLGLANTYHNSQQYEKARVFWKKYKAHQPSYENTAAQFGATVLEAKLALADKNIAAAIDVLIKVEEILKPLEQKGALSWYVQLYDLQAKVAISQKDFKTAYFKQKEARKLLRDDYKTERETARSKYKVMFDTDQEILKNKLLEQDKALSKAALESAEQRQKMQDMIIMVFLLFVLVLFYFIYRQILNSKALNKIANTDSLTELANRRCTFIYAEKMLLLAKKTQQKFSMIVFDVDHFKLVNDSYGHGGGDIALKELSSTANKYVRNHDVLGRIGGEEFLLILPEASAIQAFEIAERIRQAIEGININIEGNIVNITASFGISELTEQRISVNQIFNSADTALYQAKNQGRNQVIIAR